MIETKSIYKLVGRDCGYYANISVYINQKH